MQGRQAMERTRDVTGGSRPCRLRGYDIPIFDLSWANESVALEEDCPARALSISSSTEREESAISPYASASDSCSSTFSFMRSSRATVPRESTFASLWLIFRVASAVLARALSVARSFS